MKKYLVEADFNEIIFNETNYQENKTSFKIDRNDIEQLNSGLGNKDTNCVELNSKDIDSAKINSIFPPTEKINYFNIFNSIFKNKQNSSMKNTIPSINTSNNNNPKIIEPRTLFEESQIRINFEQENILQVSKKDSSPNFKEALNYPLVFSKVDQNIETGNLNEGEQIFNSSDINLLENDITSLKIENVSLNDGINLKNDLKSLNRFSIDNVIMMYSPDIPSAEGHERYGQPQHDISNYFSKIDFEESSKCLFTSFLFLIILVLFVVVAILKNPEL